MLSHLDSNPDLRLRPHQGQGRQDRQREPRQHQLFRRLQIIIHAIVTKHVK